MSLSSSSITRTEKVLLLAPLGFHGQNSYLSVVEMVIINYSHFVFSSITTGPIHSKLVPTILRGWGFRFVQLIMKGRKW
jgi:hypothetical protein